MAKMLYISINVPTEYADKVRLAIGDAGAGKLGNYSHTSFSIKGMGRSKALEGANPHSGTVGQYTPMEEEKVETTCEKKDLDSIIKAVRQVHPYEEPVIIIYPIEMV